MWCDSRASSWPITLQPLCLGHEPKAKVATNNVYGPNQFPEKLTPKFILLAMGSPSPSMEMDLMREATCTVKMWLKRLRLCYTREVLVMFTILGRKGKEVWLWTVWNRRKLLERQGLFLQELLFLRSCLFLPVVVVVALLLLLLLLLYGRIEICRFIFAAAPKTWRTWSCYYCFHIVSKTIPKELKDLQKDLPTSCSADYSSSFLLPSCPNLSPLFLSFWKYYFSCV
jgi:hypothetical protein